MENIISIMANNKINKYKLMHIYIYIYIYLYIIKITLK